MLMCQCLAVANASFMISNGEAMRLKG